MKSQSSAIRTLSMPWIVSRNKSHKTPLLLHYNMQVLLQYLQQLVACGFVAGVAVLVVITSSLSQGSATKKTLSATQRLPYPYTSLFSTATLSTDQSLVKQAGVKFPRKGTPAATIPTCARTADATTTPFATCPTFSINFAKQPNGLPSTKVFNIYAGKPVVNQEAQLYTNSQQNLRVENGSLELKALDETEQGFNYTSARIDTQGKEDFLYGKIVVRATLPDGIGTWPAIWMLSANNKYEALSPPSDPERYLNDGEIDIAESVGTQHNVIYGVAHSLAYPVDGSNRNYYNTVTVPGNASTPHDYELDWTPTNLTFTVDGNPYFSINKQPGANYQSWPYDQPFYLILNLALGGTWGGTDLAQFPGDGVDPSSLPATMKIQSINYYPYTGAPAASNN